MEPVDLERVGKLFRRPLRDDQVLDVLMAAVVRLHHHKGRAYVIHVLTTAVDELSNEVAR